MKVLKIFNTRMFFNDAVICYDYVASVINKVKNDYGVVAGW